MGASIAKLSPLGLIAFANIVQPLFLVKDLLPLISLGLSHALANSVLFPDQPGDFSCRCESGVLKEYQKNPPKWPLIIILDTLAEFALDAIASADGVQHPHPHQFRR